MANKCPRARFNPTLEAPDKGLSGIRRLREDAAALETVRRRVQGVLADEIG